jgi:hypothetical protein
MQHFHNARKPHEDSRHAAKATTSAQRPGRNLHVGLATSQTEVLEAQKLRYRSSPTRWAPA